MKTAETLQKIIDVRHECGSRSQVRIFSSSSQSLSFTRPQVIDVLALLLPESSLYSVLSTLPPPNPTNPLSTTTSVIQEAVYNSLPILEEIVILIEKDEDETVKKEIDKRRQRLGASIGEELVKEVVRERLGTSKANLLKDWVTLC